ncbi:hypothetical protein [Phaeobacter gallaeciensis]|uniref:hypothetical protein n=1 Tax=Phaeobacter gallaeciensis TaxID=60890 RepID=UPI00237FA8D8|nr:hypothetical protein [Phaeobacter gallaeciensis]MDE4189693.1 hypothetical protein [Phaeobacter gallaeciensis]MDE4198846.1 hypothetical protein [Phaeobacter gallaeciensis]MDE4202993.1 hypothetical protein [Phaeobacter gallaeciensis]MDE4207135.1 hypothetical protein [Phaeobacter gallaeciensis]MDE4215641.1 hypothetical protein [Phaeobacter gallaeciensis]
MIEKISSVSVSVSFTGTSRKGTRLYCCRKKHPQQEERVARSNPDAGKVGKWAVWEAARLKTTQFYVRAQPEFGIPC